MHRSILAALVLAVLLTPLDGRSTAAAPPLKAAGRIAFSVDTGIASMNPDGSGGWGGRVLLPGDTQPAWSPDGTMLAVATRWQGNEGIRLDNPDGSTIRMLTTTPGDGSPAWSPDGTKLAFVDNGKLLVVNADGSGRRELPTSTGYVNASPSWSPDGAKIAFSAYGDSGSDIFALDLASGAQAAVHRRADERLVAGLVARRHRHRVLRRPERLDGGPGTDWLAGGMGVDVLIGSQGRDRLDARDGGHDTVIGDGDRSRTTSRSGDRRLRRAGRPRIRRNERSTVAWTTSGTRVAGRRNGSRSISVAQPRSAGSG